MRCLGRSKHRQGQKQGEGETTGRARMRRRSTSETSASLTRHEPAFPSLPPSPLRPAAEQRWPACPPHLAESGRAYGSGAGAARLPEPEDKLAPSRPQGTGVESTSATHTTGRPHPIIPPQGSKRSTRLGTSGARLEDTDFRPVRLSSSLPSFGSATCQTPTKKEGAVCYLA